MNKPTADVSVRVSWPADADAIAQVQGRAWQTSYADLLPAELLSSFHTDEVAAGWHAAMAKPTDARNRVLVALERNTVTGFAVCTPAQDPDCDPIADGEMLDLTVDPDRRGQGHGSRLVQAVADTLMGDRFTRAVTWVMATDDAMREFLTSAGWAPDGAHRELDLDGSGDTRVKQIRLHTSLG